MGESWSAAEEDERAERVTEIDLSAIALVTCLKKDEALQAGERCLQLRKETRYGRLGGRAFLALGEEQKVIPQNWKSRSCLSSSTERS